MVTIKVLTSSFESTATFSKDRLLVMTFTISWRALIDGFVI
jgi:hypothetical protein